MIKNMKTDISNLSLPHLWENWAIIIFIYNTLPGKKSKCLWSIGRESIYHHLPDSIGTNRNCPKIFITLEYKSTLPGIVIHPGYIDLRNLWRG